MSKLSASDDSKKYVKVSTDDDEKVTKENEDTKPYGFGVRHVQIILIFASLTFIYIARAQINVTIVAMTDKNASEDENDLIQNNTEEFENSTDGYDFGLECINDTFIFRTNENETDYDSYDSKNISCSYVDEELNELDLNVTIKRDENVTIERDENISIWDVYRIYPWPKSTQEMVLGSFFLGYLIMTTPMGMVCQRWGGKLPLQISLFNSAIITFFTPWLAVWGDYKAVCISRVMIGLSQAGTYPSLHTLVAKWVPPCEIGRLGTYVYTGSMLGSLLAFYTSGYLSASFLGWPSVFWVTGLTNLIMFIMVTIFIAPTPQEHKTISEDEKKFILGELHGQVVKRRPTPWKAIFTSIPVAATLTAHFGNSVMFVFFFTQVPTYLHYIVGVNIRNSGLLSSLPYLANFLTSIVLGNLADYCVNNKIMTTKRVRIISNCFANIIPAMCLFGVSFTTSPTLAVFCLILCMAGCAGSHTGWMVNYIDLAPNYSGALMATGNTLMNIGAIILPALVSNIVTDVRNVHQWRIMLFLVATVGIICNTVYIFFMSADVQPWNEPTYEATETEDVEAEDKVNNKEILK